MVAMEKPDEINHEELIAAVQKFPSLYNTNDPDYMKVTLKDKLWNEIVKDLKFTDCVEARNAWAKLRRCHRQALVRRKCPKFCAISTPWKYQKQMEFLVPYMKSIDSNNEEYENLENENLHTEFEYVESEDFNIKMENNEADNFDNTEENIRLIESHLETETSDTPVRCIESPSISSSSAPINKRHTKEDTTKQLSCAKRKLEPQEPRNDHLYHFFMSMYELTKQMPPASQHLVRNNVFQAVSKVESDLLNRNHNPIQYPNTQNMKLQYKQSYSQLTHNNPSSEVSPTNTSPLTYYDSDTD